MSSMGSRTRITCYTTGSRTNITGSRTPSITCMAMRVMSTVVYILLSRIRMLLIISIILRSSLSRKNVKFINVCVL